jgi:hypothetical protein
MALTFTIAGVDRTSKVRAAELEGGRQVSFTRVAGSPAALTLSTYDRNGLSGYRPAIDDTIVVADGATTVFSGVITDIAESSLSDANTGFDTGILCGLTCSDQNGLLLRDSYTKTYASSTTLKAILQDLVTNVLAARGVTLDAAQATGPTLVNVKFADAYTDDILNTLTAETGWVWDITPGKVLSMISPGSVSCGFSLTDGGGGVFGGVGKKQGRSQNYCNRVVLSYGPDAQVVLTDSFTGNGVTTAWALTYAPVPNGAGWILSRGLVHEGAADLPLGRFGVDPTLWTYDLATNLLHRSSALGVGVVATFTYTVQFPQSVTRNNSGEQVAHGVYTKKFEAKDVTDLQLATQLADGLLSQGIAAPLIVTVAHRKGLAKPGQSVAMTFSERGINATFMIVEVGFVSDVDSQLTWTITAVSGSQLQASWVDYFKKDGSSGTTSAATGSASSGDSAGAHRAVLRRRRR